MANEEVNTGRRRFLTATTAVVGAVGAGFAAVPFIKSWSPSARARQAWTSHRRAGDRPKAREISWFHRTNGAVATDR